MFDKHTFISDGNRKNVMKLLDSVTNEMDAKTKLLLFLMNSRKEKNDKCEFCWTLLVLNPEIKTWGHYNSSPPRGKKKNVYMEDAKHMVMLQNLSTFPCFTWADGT